MTDAAPGSGGSEDVLERFSPATREWFTSSFSAPTPAQAGAWAAVSEGRHTLVVAPTGSGKTLSAFLWAIDRLAAEPPPPDPQRRCRVLYVSPMKALAVDVERNLRSPLVGIGHAAQRLGLPVPEVTVSVRSGDTSQKDRRSFVSRPTDILITTPESLFLLLTSQGREALRGVQTVILDEVHAVAGTKRGAHLAVSLDRLDVLLERPATRVGLSATVRPVDEVARFLTGGRPVEVVAPPSTKEWDLEVVVPVPDLADLGAQQVDLDSPVGADPERQASIWPHVEERIVDLVAGHTSTLVFANSRRLAERLTARLNEIWEERLVEAGEAEARDAPPRPPALLMASGRAQGAPPVLARAHHGSVSKEQRAQIESDLKSGRLPAVVATSSLELGIDMGAVDLVVQVESPPSVASGLQRVGRAGHQVGAVSHGVLFPKFRADLVQTAVVVDRMRSGAIESIAVPANPVDVLAQHCVSLCAMDEWTVDGLLELARRSAPYATLPRSVLEATLDMLAGRYPSDEFAELRPRIVWDRVTDTLTGRPGAARLAVTSGGTIPDRGLYGVFLAGDGAGRRVGELDEEMVYESRVGDVFTLGSTSWRIEDITHDQVLVSPAPGQPGRLPFWKGDTLGRPAELGAAVGAYVRELSALSDAEARARVTASGLDEWAADNLLTYLAEQREATRVVPDDRTLVVERFRDELGDWRIVVHSPFGTPVHAPWALALSARMRERYGVEVQAMAADDGIVLRLPDMGLGDDPWATQSDDAAPGPPPPAADLSRDLLETITLEPDDVHGLVTQEVGGSALFAARFRECAARALLLPRRRPDKRQALWQQRQRAASLLEVASRYPSFPIVLEAVRECLQDVFDVPGLAGLMRDVAARRVQVVEVETSSPSPFARSLLFGYVAQYLYEGDSPLAERRAAALSLDPALLAELLGRGEGASLRDLLDPEAITRTEAQLQRLDPERRCRDAEAVADLLRVVGPLSPAEVARRCTEPDAAAGLLASLLEGRRVIEVSMAGERRVAVVEDAARLRDALGVAIPPGVAHSLLEPSIDPLGSLAARYARTHGPFPARALAEHLGIGVALVTDALRRLVTQGRLVEGELLPEQLGGGGQEFCDAEVLRTIRRRSLAALRAEVEPVTPQDYARFLPAWNGLGTLRGREGVLRAVEQLSGARVPASALESLVLPARVRGYAPGLLDEVMAAGDVVWQGHGALAGDDGWVSLHLADTAPLTLAEPDLADLPDGEREVLSALAAGGAYHFRSLADSLVRTDDTRLADDLWQLVWRGAATGDTFAPVRALVAGGRSTHKLRAPGPRSTAYGRRGALGTLGGASYRSGRLGRPPAVQRSGPPTVTGRWSALPDVEADTTARAFARAELLLDRYGILTRGAVTAEDVPGGFAGVYRICAAAEEAGRLRRGYFVEGLGASQFGTGGAVDHLRASSRPLPQDDAPPSPLAHLGRQETWGAVGPARPDPLVLAATDPANPFGAALDWPEGPAGSGHRPARKAGALVVLDDGDPSVYVERGGRTVLTFTDDPARLEPAARALAACVQESRLAALTVEKIDGAPVLGLDHPLVAGLVGAGFHTTPKGLRLRR